jgi:hypothetical protein
MEYYAVIQTHHYFKKISQALYFVTGTELNHKGDFKIKAALFCPYGELNMRHEFADNVKSILVI